MSQLHVEICLLFGVKATRNIAKNNFIVIQKISLDFLFLIVQYKLDVSLSSFLVRKGLIAVLLLASRFAVVYAAARYSESRYLTISTIQIRLLI